VLHTPASRPSWSSSGQIEEITSTCSTDHRADQNAGGARAKEHTKFDKIILWAAHPHAPGAQPAGREYHMSPNVRPDEAVANGAALYGSRNHSTRK